MLVADSSCSSLLTGQQERQPGRNYKRHLIVRDERFEPQGKGSHKFKTKYVSSNFAEKENLIFRFGEHCPNIAASFRHNYLLIYPGRLLANSF